MSFFDHESYSHLATTNRFLTCQFLREGHETMNSYDYSQDHPLLINHTVFEQQTSRQTGRFYIQCFANGKISIIRERKYVTSTASSTSRTLARV